MRKEVSMAYVAFCVTLTCTAATMTTVTFRPAFFNVHGDAHTSAQQDYLIVQAPIIERPDAAKPSYSRYFSAGRFRFGRNYNKLANGGLLVMHVEPSAGMSV